MHVYKPVSYSRVESLAAPREIKFVWVGVERRTLCFFLVCCHYLVPSVAKDERMRGMFSIAGDDSST